MTRIGTARIAVLVGTAAVVAVLAVTVAHHVTEASHRSGPSAAGPVAREAEDTFVAVTAAHLCQVGQGVYDNPKALADAYQSAPPYPGLTAGQVTDLTGRLRTDQALGDRVTRQLQATCHRPAGH